MSRRLGYGHRFTTHSHARDRYGAEQIMWNHLQRELARGRTPSGAELDRAAGTNNYGRRLLRKWRQQGLITRESTAQDDSDRALPTSAPAADGAGS